jgi:RNA polymerase sigma-70 factor, ECF subfamily
MDTELLSDPELLVLAQRFDPQALAQIYDICSPGLYRYAMRLLGDQNLAEDCVAETFSRFLQALRTKRGPENYLQAYLYRMAHNWIVDQYRREPNQPVELTEEHLDENADPEIDAGLHLRQEHLRMAIKTLTPDQQQVIALKYLEGWENEEIARSLKKPVGAIKSMQHRALASLQRTLGSEESL